MGIYDTLLTDLNDSELNMYTLVLTQADRVHLSFSLVSWAEELYNILCDCNETAMMWDQRPSPISIIALGEDDVYMIRDLFAENDFDLSTYPKELRDKFAYICDLVHDME